MTNNMLRYEKLKAQRPSIVRAHAGSFVYWLICGLLAFVFLTITAPTDIYPLSLHDALPIPSAAPTFWWHAAS